MTITLLSKTPSELIPYKYNNKEHDDAQIEKIANSIKEFGFNQPLVIDEKNNVIVGHGRLLAAQKLGLTDIPCFVVKNLTEEQKNKYRIRDNKLNESEWNVANLKQQLDELENMNLGELILSKREIFPEFEVPEFNPAEYTEIAEKAKKVEETNNEEWKKSNAGKLSLTVFVNDTAELELLKKDLIELGYTNFY